MNGPTRPPQGEVRDGDTGASIIHINKKNKGTIIKNRIRKRRQPQANFLGGGGGGFDYVDS